MAYTLVPAGKVLTLLNKLNELAPIRYTVVGSFDNALNWYVSAQYRSQRQSEKAVDDLAANRNIGYTVFYDRVAKKWYYIDEGGPGPN
jgi:hypothetical protein